MTPLPLLPPLTPGGNPVLLIDNSTLDLYNACAREGEYGHIENYVSANDKPALNFGAAAHEGWKARYKMLDHKAIHNIEQTTYEIIDKDGTAQQLCGTPEVIQNEVITHHFNDHPQPLDEFRSPSLCLELMARYNECYGDEPWEIITNPKTGKKCVEQSVMVFLGTLWHKDRNIESPRYGEYAIDLYYTGRIDLIIRDSSGVWILDHKTTFQFGSSFTASMSMSAQFLGYAWAYQQIFGTLPIGYIINAVRVRRPTQKALLAEDYFRPSGPDPDFARIPFYINPDNVAEWKENTLALVRTILYHHSQGFFPMNRTQCQRKWGPCQFFEVCNCAREVRSEILKSQAFMQNEWSPLNKAEQAENNKP